MNPLTNAMNTCILEWVNLVRLGNHPPASETTTIGIENNNARRYGDTDTNPCSEIGTDNINVFDIRLVFSERGMCQERTLEP